MKNVKNVFHIKDFPEEGEIFHCFVNFFVEHCMNNKINLTKRRGHMSLAFL